VPLWNQFSWPVLWLSKHKELVRAQAPAPNRLSKCFGGKGAYGILRLSSFPIHSSCWICPSSLKVKLMLDLCSLICNFNSQNDFLIEIFWLRHFRRDSDRIAFATSTGDTRFHFEVFFVIGYNGQLI